MPIILEKDDSRDLTTFTLTGEMTLDELLTALASYGKAGPSLYELYDAREVTGQRPSFDEINKLAGYLTRFSKKRPTGSKTAIVVNKDVDYGLSRMISILTETTTIYDIQVFRKMESARTWLMEK